MTESIERPITAVVAMTPGGVIGRDGSMPWRLSSDLKRFKQLTMGGVLVMGRKTYESIGRPLPGRRTIVVSRQCSLSLPGAEVVDSPDKAIDLAGRQQVFVVGGAEIYRQLLERCEQVYLTKVLSDVDGDTHLEFNWDHWRIVDHQRIASGPKDDAPTEFFHLIRKSSGQKS